MIDFNDVKGRKEGSMSVEDISKSSTDKERLLFPAKSEVKRSGFTKGDIIPTRKVGKTARLFEDKLAKSLTLPQYRANSSAVLFCSSRTLSEALRFRRRSVREISFTDTA
jgi:hypothetical protein